MQRVNNGPESYFWWHDHLQCFGPQLSVWLPASVRLVRLQVKVVLQELRPDHVVHCLNIPLRIPNRDVNPRVVFMSPLGGNYISLVVIQEAEIIVGLACIRIYGAPFLMLARTLPMTVLFLRSGTVAKRTWPKPRLCLYLFRFPWLEEDSWSCV